LVYAFFFVGGGQSVIWPKRGHGNLAALLFMQQPAAVYVHVRFGHVFAPSNTCSSCFPFSASFSNIGCQMSPLGAVHMPREKPTEIQTKLTHKKQWSISCFFPVVFGPLWSMLNLWGTRKFLEDDKLIQMAYSQSYT